jgi:hypothetical protein
MTNTSVHTRDRSAHMTNRSVHLRDISAHMTNRSVHMRDRSAQITNRSVHMRNRSAQMTNRGVHMRNSTPHRHGLNACQMQSSKFCILLRLPVRLRSSGMFLPIPLQDLRTIHLETYLILSFRLHRRLPCGLLRLNFRATIFCIFFIMPRRATCPTQK